MQPDSLSSLNTRLTVVVKNSLIFSF